MSGVVCAECGAPMVLRQTAKFKYKNGQPRKFYGCSRYPECKGVHGAHPDGKPLGVPANAETKAHRSEAHRMMERVQMLNRWSKDQMYEFLAGRMGIDTHDCHIGMFGAEQCQRVVDICRQELGVCV